MLNLACIWLTNLNLHIFVGCDIGHECDLGFLGLLKVVLYKYQTHTEKPVSTNVD